MLDEMIDRYQKRFPPNRVALMLAPFVAILAGSAAPWLAQHFPGLPTFSAGQLTAFGVAVVGGVVALIYKWVDGYQKYEATTLGMAEAEVQRAHEERLALIQKADHVSQIDESLEHRRT